MTKRQIGNTVGIIFGVVWITVLAIAHFRGAATDSWQAAPGEVVSLDVKKKWIGGKRRHSTRRNNHKAEIVYQYTVDGNTYTSSTHHIGAHGLSASLTGSKTYMKQAYQLNTRYAPGAEVTVYFDPDDPERAVLRRGSSVGLPMFLIGFAAIGLGATRLFKT